MSNNDIRKEGFSRSTCSGEESTDWQVRSALVCFLARLPTLVESGNPNSEHWSDFCVRQQLNVRQHSPIRPGRDGPGLAGRKAFGGDLTWRSGIGSCCRICANSASSSRSDLVFLDTRSLLVPWLVLLFPPSLPPSLCCCCPRALSSSVQLECRATRLARIVDLVGCVSWRKKLCAFCAWQMCFRGLGVLCLDCEWVRPGTERKRERERRIFRFLHLRRVLENCASDVCQARLPVRCWSFVSSERAS